MNTYKKRFITLVSTAFLVPASLIGTNYILDPSEIYHKSFFREKCSVFDSIEKNAGYINHYLDDYNAVVLGSSLSLNFDLDLLKELTGKDFFMTAASGLKSKAITMIARRLFEKDAQNRIQTVYWELYHQKMLSGDVIKDNFAMYLLNDDVTDDLPYLMSFKTLKNGFKVAKKQCSSGKYTGWRYDKDHEKTAARYRSPENVAALNERIAENQKRLADYEARFVDVPSVSQEIIPLIRKYPNKRYVFYVAPTDLADITDLSAQELNAYFSMIDLLLKEAENGADIKIYAAVWNKDLIMNAAQYRDDQHYIGTVNDDMVHEITREKRMLTPENFASFVREMTDWIKHGKMHV